MKPKKIKFAHHEVKINLANPEEESSEKIAERLQAAESLIDDMATALISLYYKAGKGDGVSRGGRYTINAKTLKRPLLHIIDIKK